MTQPTDRTDPSDTLPSVVRTVIDIAAAPERVFEALTDARELGEWWSADGDTPESCEADARPGGAWRSARAMMAEPKHDSRSPTPRQ